MVQQTTGTCEKVADTSTIRSLPQQKLDNIFEQRQMFEFEFLCCLMTSGLSNDIRHHIQQLYSHQQLFKITISLTIRQTLEA